MQKFNFNNPGGLLNLNPNDTGSLGINISPINEQKKLEDEQRKKEEQRLKLQNLADTFNMIVPVSNCATSDQYAEYLTARGPLSLPLANLTLIDAVSRGQCIFSFTALS